jgi:hypothetical protein
MADPAKTPQLPPETSAAFAEFARACKAAARAVALYPGSHPAIGASLARLAQCTARLAEQGPFRLEIRAGSLLLNGNAAQRPDPAIGELAEVLSRHTIGALTVNAAADAGSWRTLLLLLARTPEEVRADGGIARLWSTAGGPSLEIVEIDYAEVLREKEGEAATIEQVIAAALAGPQLELDDTTFESLLRIVNDPDKLRKLMTELEEAAGKGGAEAKAAAIMSLLRGLVEYVSRTSPDQLEHVFKKVATAAGAFSAETMAELLAQAEKPGAVTGTTNIVEAMTSRMSDTTIAQFVSNSVVAERGATGRLKAAFQALVPERDRQRQLLALAETDAAASELGQDASFPELWERVEGMLTTYSDEDFVSSAYGRELSNARTRAIDVEQIADDPPERVAGWLGSVSDTALHGLDDRLLLDLLVIEKEPLRWRDMAQTVIGHADDLIRVGQFERAWQLADSVLEEGDRVSERMPHARAALEQLGRGSMIRHVAAHLRSADDEAFARFQRLVLAMGTAVIAPLAEVLSAEQDARSRRRLRDALLGFGAQGRESVQQLMNASNWEVRRTAAFLLREFGGSEGLKELIPLLTDSEPLVQREAVQGLVMNGTEEASAILLRAVTGASGRTRATLIAELMSIRDERVVPAFAYFLRHMNARVAEKIYDGAVEAIGNHGGAEAVEALKFALHQGEWWAPLRTRRRRTAAAAALRTIGTEPALEALRAASTRGPRGVRTIARGELARLES